MSQIYSQFELMLNRLKRKIDELRLTRLEREEVEDYLNAIYSLINRLIEENRTLESTIKDLEREIASKKTKEVVSK